MLPFPCIVSKRKRGWRRQPTLAAEALFKAYQNRYLLNIKSQIFAEQRFIQGKILRPVVDKNDSRKPRITSQSAVSLDIFS